MKSWFWEALFVSVCALLINAWKHINEQKSASENEIISVLKHQDSSEAKMLNAALTKVVNKRVNTQRLPANIGESNSLSEKTYSGESQDEIVDLRAQWQRNPEEAVSHALDLVTSKESVEWQSIQIISEMKLIGGASPQFENFISEVLGKTISPAIINAAVDSLLEKKPKETSIQTLENAIRHSQQADLKRLIYQRALYRAPQLIEEWGTRFDDP